MKNLYHLLVTSNKLRVTNLLCRISDIGYRIFFIAFCFFPFFAFSQTQEATVTDVVFSCPGTVTVTYNLVSCNSVDVTLYYSSENCGWSPAVTEENVQPGTGKTITWDAAADNVSFGKFYYKVEYSGTFDDPEPVLINGVKWAPVNLDVGGWFCEHPWDYGGLFQWGRMADGHENPTSATIPTLSSTGVPGHGYFILTPNIPPYDWCSPKNDALWNSGTEFCSIDPCPENWHVPTGTEFQTLGVWPDTNGKELQTNYEGSGISGTLVTDQFNGNTLFFPFTGYRAPVNGVFGQSGAGGGGYYWGSTPGANSASQMQTRLSGSTPIIQVPLDANGRGYGMAIRCVHD